MNKTLIASALILASTTAIANQCDVQIEGNMLLENNVLTITTEQRNKIVIEQNQQVYVNGTRLSLTGEQQRWVADYYAGINKAVPEVASIAFEGVAIATTAVSEVFGNLLGSDTTALDEVIYKLEQLNLEIHHSFYADDGSIRLDSSKFKDGSFFGEHWGVEFEHAIEQVVTSSIGSIMIALGTELLFNGGDSNAFEQRMETFADDLERKVESRALILEEKADGLCNQMANIDYAENQLQNTVSQLSDLNMIVVNSRPDRM